MKFDTETFKPWIGNLNLANGWNPVTVSAMREYLEAKQAQGFSMMAVKEAVQQCQFFMDAISPALIEGDGDVIISVLVKNDAVEYVNGPQFKRYGESDIVLQVGLAKYNVELDSAGNIKVGALQGTVQIAAMTKEENRVEVPVKDENGNPRFKATVEMMDLTNEETPVFQVWFAFQKNLKDEKGNFVVATLPKLKIALNKGELYKYLALANEAGSGGSSNGEETVWIDMRMLPKGLYNITKVIGPKKKVYEDGGEKNLWFLEIEGYGMAQAHAILAADLEVMGEDYKKEAELGQLRVRVTEHVVNFQHIDGSYKKVEYFPDFFQAWEAGEVTPVKKGFAGENRKHYMSMTFVTGGEYEFQPILTGIVQKALSINVSNNPVALPAATVVTKPVAELKSAAVVEEEAADLDSIPF